MTAEPTPTAPLRSVPRTPPTPNALMASARTLTSKNLKRLTKAKDDRRNDVWDMYDLIGEQRFLANAIGGRVGAAYLYIGKLDPANPDKAPEPADPATDPIPASLLKGFGETPGARTQLLTRMGVNLFQEGDAYFVGFPRDLWERLTNPKPQMDRMGMTTMPDPDPGLELDDEGNPVGIPLTDLIWRTLSTDELIPEEGKVKLKLVEAVDEEVELFPEQLLIIRVWRPHPRNWWKADAPALSSLPIMRELVGLTMRLSSQIDSRLKGAGIQVVPQTAMKAAREQAGIDPDDAATNPFIDAMISAGETAIQDPDSAAASVPIFIGVPDEVADATKWPRLKYDSELDTQSIELRKEQLERLAMGQDVPFEVLFGVGSMNHWGAWLVKEDTVTTHVEPPLSLICDAITSQWVWEVLEQNDFTPDAAHEWVCWYSVAHLVQKPDKLQDAKDLHKAGVIGDPTLRDEAGYTDEDAPAESLSIEQQMVLNLVQQAPSLAQDPGMPALLGQVRALLAGEEGPPTTPTSPVSAPDAPADGGDGQAPTEGPPDTADDPPNPEGDGIAASGSPVLEPDAIITPGEMDVRRRTDGEVFAEAFAGIVERLANVDPPTVNVHVDAPDPSPVTVNVPEGLVHVNVEPAQAQAPDVHMHVEPTPVTVEGTTVHVDPTPVHVAPAQVNVEAAQVHVAPTPVNVEAPQVHVDGAQVTVEPTPLTVNVEPAPVHVKESKPRKVTKTVLRNDAGDITGVIEEG